METSPPLGPPLESRLAAAGEGADAAVLVLAGPSGEAVRGAVSDVVARSAGRVLLVTVPSSASEPTAATDALALALGARAGAARLLDPLVRGAAGFVLGRELARHSAALEPAALDAAAPATAELLRRRFVPAFHAQAPDVPLELLAALVRARTGVAADAGSPDLAAAARALGPAGLVRAVGQLAHRAQVVVTVVFEGALERPAATAARALETPLAPGFVVLLPAVRDLWTTEKVLLSEAERARLVELAPVGPAAQGVTPFAPPVASPAAPAAAADTPSGSGTTITTPSGRVLSPRERVLAKRASGPLERASTPGDGNPALAPNLARTPGGGLPALARTPGGGLPALAGTPGSRPPGSGSGLRAPGARPGAPRRPSDEGKIPGTPGRSGSAEPRRVSRVSTLSFAAVPIIAFVAIVALSRTEPEADRGGKPSAENVAMVRPAPAPAPSPSKAARPAAPPATHAPPAPGPAPSPKSWTPPDPYADAKTPADVLAILARELPIALSLETRTTLLERALPRLDGETRARVLVGVIDAPPGSPQDARFLRRYAIERLAPLTVLPDVSARFVQLLDASSARDERLCALRAIALNPVGLSPELRDKLATLAAGREDGPIPSQARAILDAADATPAAGSPLGAPAH